MSELRLKSKRTASRDGAFNHLMRWSRNNYSTCVQVVRNACSYKRVCVCMHLLLPSPTRGTCSVTIYLTDYLSSACQSESTTQQPRPQDQGLMTRRPVKRTKLTGPAVLSAGLCRALPLFWPHSPFSGSQVAQWVKICVQCRRRRQMWAPSSLAPLSRERAPL